MSGSRPTGSTGCSTGGDRPGGTAFPPRIPCGAEVMPGIEGGGDRFREARELLERGAVERAYQAAVLLLARKEEILLHESAGEAHLSSIFDVSYLTKPLVVHYFYLT